MAHIDSIGAGMFSDLSVEAFYDAATHSSEALSKITTDAAFNTHFVKAISASAAASETRTEGDFVRINNIREFPSIGTPPNIVQVPVYGSKTSRQIQGQADAPSMELTINYVGSEWDSAGVLGSMVGDGKQHIFRFTLLNSEPLGSGETKYASTSAGLGTVQNTIYYFIGKIEALQVNPQLTDANQATVTISVQSDMYGAFTLAKSA